jgi:hypothetical protein
MEQGLTSWLGKTLRTDVRLGLNWLEGRLAKPSSARIAQATIPCSDPSWDQLYRDDGTNLRIFVTCDPGKQRNVQVRMVCSELQTTGLLLGRPRYSQLTLRTSGMPIMRLS